MRTYNSTNTYGRLSASVFSRRLILLAISLLVVGCANDSDSSPDNPANDSTNEQTMPANDSVKDLLKFSNTEDEQRFQCIYDQFSALAQTNGITGYDMEHVESQKLVTKLWCDGKGDKDPVACQIPGFSGPLRGAGSQFMHLRTYVVESFPEVAETFESFGRNPVDDSWGIEFHRFLPTPSSVTQGDVRTGSVSVSFSRINDEGEFQTQLNFDQNIGHTFGAELVVVDLPGNTLDDFKQLSASPELFITTFDARYDVLQAEVESKFESGELADESGSELSNALAYIDGQRKIIRSDAPQLHALLTSFVDTTLCK